MTTGSRPALLARLWRYQAERFALAQFVPLITLFTFSSVAYSRLSRGAPGFIPWSRFVVGAVTAIVFFFLLRVLDEHKDQDLDRRFRPELPVPRGLVSLAELRGAAIALASFVLVLNALLGLGFVLLLAPAALWATLMTKEFFARDWLRAHPTAYLLSHMAIMPMVDFYTTGIDWAIDGARPPHALAFFLAVTFWNGVLIEVGRKIRAPLDEREGVGTYTHDWGLRVAPAVWLGVLGLSLAFAISAARATSELRFTAPLLVAVAACCAVPSLVFLREPTSRRARAIESASGLWPFVTYLSLGSGPWLFHWLAGAGR
jgi:4-hydroxybenzoate polyprenyltransferase